MTSQADHDRAIIVQSDGSLLVDVTAHDYESTREDLSIFAQIVKTPENIHTYRITPVSLWNASASGWTPERVRDLLDRHARYQVPDNVISTIREQMNRWGRLVLENEDAHEKIEWLRLTARDIDIPTLMEKYSSLREILNPHEETDAWLVKSEDRGKIKHILSKLGHPVIDCAGFTDGTPLPVQLRKTTSTGLPFSLRTYQKEAVDAFLSSETRPTRNPNRLYRGDGHGVIVLSCGAGKTMVGIGAMTRLGMHTLILATGTTAVRQWIHEILDKTDLSPDDVGEYSGQRKEIRPVTVATYQIATRAKHRNLFERSDFGFIIYDEVHLLPAPLFRTTAYLQARRRLGMTATLVREDGRESEVFSLIGPKRYDMPWRSLEGGGWVAKARCRELRVPASPELHEKIMSTNKHSAYRLAAENPEKEKVVAELVKKHPDERILVIGQYLSQLRRIASRLRAPLLTGEVHQDERDILFRDFKNAKKPILVVSRVANFSVDLPDASVCIQVSGLFGSRQEEAQRLGRILRPKSDGREALFYTLVTPETSEQHFALARQRFLTEQGYKYSFSNWSGRVNTARISPKPVEDAL